MDPHEPDDPYAALSPRERQLLDWVLAREARRNWQPCPGGRPGGGRATFIAACVRELFTVDDVREEKP